MVAFFLRHPVEALTIDVKENKNAIKSISIESTKEPDQTKIWELKKQLDFLKEENSKLKSENLCLKTENKDLTERTSNLSYILADLQGKTKNAEEERDSLITAMRRLVLESSAEDKNNVSINMQNCDNQTKFNEADDCTTQSTEDVLNSNIQLENRYSALEDQLKEAGQSTTAKAVHQDQARNEKNKGKSKSKSKQSTNESNKNLSDDQIQLQQEEQQEPKTKTSVVVAGDSMLRYVNGWELYQLVGKMFSQVFFWRYC